MSGGRGKKDCSKKTSRNWCFKIEGRKEKKNKGKKAREKKGPIT